MKGGLRGSLRPPGDKSVSHRAVLLGSVNDGPVTVTGFLRSADTLATVAGVRALGVQVDDQGERLVVHGVGWEGLQEPDDVIDVANSGTLLRLLPGLVASRDFLCVLTGDASIRRRPMGRVLEPLAAMGVKVAGRRGNSLPPVAVWGGALRGIEYRMPIASAQVKSAILLAGLRAAGQTTIVESAASRDHTERMIEYGGGRVEREGSVGGAGMLRIWPLERLRMGDLAIPGDFSSAAFFLVAALLVPGSEISVKDVGLNPTRTGLLRVLQRMGGRVTAEQERALGSEPVGTVTALSSELQATDVDATEVPCLIDELPLFLLAAARAKGVSRLRGAAELRAKESDRLEAMAALLRALGVQLTEYPDGMDVKGDPNGWEGGDVQACADHRLAMVGAIAGAASRRGVRVDDLECVSVSYPGFVDALTGLGGAVVAPEYGERAEVAG
ncbi:MAG: 3-phosphoshikimate 1-carboxyvinyltransferase [Thermoleophilia bacterium]|nr:3-phosphoshikimate 1-carboxyvinyltransferase [Thermoleophilia bacterium]